jgi:hypothetical protein
MPYFNFDLVIGEDFKSQGGGMILEDTGIAIDKADNLASELCIVRSELRLVPTAFPPEVDELADMRREMKREAVR